MLGSFFRIGIFVGVIAVITFVAAFILEEGGTILMQFGGYEVALSPLQAVIGVILLLGAVWLLLWLVGIALAVFRFFNGDETAVSRYLSANRVEKGYNALAEGMVALAAGEGKKAVDKAAAAERYLDRPELTDLFNAQAAESAGDIKRAEKYYKRLLSSQNGRFVGVQGLMKQKLAEGETDLALKLAEKAFAIRPKHAGTLDALFDLQTEKAEWKGAQKTIEAKVRAGHLPKDVGKRREAILMLEDARAQLEKGEIEKGKEIALAANKLSPDLVPAAALASEMYMLDNNRRAAGNAIRKAWAQHPHPDLAAAFAEINPDETPAQRQKRFATLTKLNPNNVETKLLTAELALADEDFPAARRAVRELAEEDPTTRALTIMAAIEKGEGADDKTVRAWLNKAMEAPRGNQWVCENCSKIHSVWQAQCSNCDGFDTLSWKATPAEQEANPASLGFTAAVLTDDTKTASSAEIAEVTSPPDPDSGAEFHEPPSNPDEPPHRS